MSRSRRKISITGNTTAASEKRDKRLANRRLRRETRVVLSQHGSDGKPLPVQREVSDRWTMDKDGKRWFDKTKYPEQMRR